jgi:hypothetical protein
MHPNKPAAHTRPIVFASTVHPSLPSQTNAVLLAESIRAFAGAYSTSPIWFMVGEATEKFSDAFLGVASALNVEIVPFTTGLGAHRIPFLIEAYAAAHAESLASGAFDVLVWLNGNTLVLKQPDAFELPEGTLLGYRPVHHTLVGSYYSEPLDSFWSLIYEICKVPQEQVFPMTPHVEDVVIRPYFNAGVIATRPEESVLAAWCDAFAKNYDLPALRSFYQTDPRYATFVHQAVLSGVILAALQQAELLEFPTTYNYPLHLYAEDLTSRRPSSVETLVTCRHEGFYKDPSWRAKMPAGEPLKQWIAGRLLF